MADGPMYRLLRVVRRIAEPDAGPLSDERLLKRFVATGDEAAFELLVRRHGAMVLGVCRRTLRDAHAAEDAFQAVFCVLARKARAVTNVAGYLHGVACRVAANERRKAARRLWHERRAAVAEIIVSDGTNADLRTVLDEELDRLPTRFRLPVVLCYLEGHTTAEAARQIGCPRGTVLSRLAAARLKLKARLTRRGLALPAGGLAAVLATPTETPAALVGPAVRAALAFAAGRTVVAGAAAPEVVTLAEGVLRAMIVSKLKMTAAVVLAVSVLGTGVGWVAQPTAGPGPAFAEALQPPAKVSEPKAVERPPNEAQPQPDREREKQQLREQLNRIKVELASLDDEAMHKRSRTRLMLIQAEEQLRQLQREHDFLREMELSRIKVAAQAETEYRRQVATNSELGKDHPKVIEAMRGAERAADDREKTLGSHKTYEKERLDQLIQARRNVSEWEDELQRYDRRITIDAGRQQLEGMRNDIQLKLLQLQHDAPRAGGADGRFDELERKISDLLREVRDLRREIRK